ncbi:right-handed parallel beta-helix repeat-containing protein (plasmid) [Streptomyces sp. BI20]|uniref:right-handed parallel beta-helix repeat-containing protein n=1 Tax=Streptomyces sp. BI20 TaxID=3403460 RepID=UPI003C77FE4C
MTTAVALSAACAAPPSDGVPGGAGAPAGGPAVLRVPSAYASVQRAVDVARPGDLVLVAPGVYREAVAMRRPGIVLRGEDRNQTVIDGEFRRSNGVTVTGAGGVVENLTVRNHLANGVLFTGVTDEALQGSGAGGGAGYDPLDTVRFPPLNGFRATRVTAHNNALYGIYSFDARGGVIEDSYASGHSDSGVYVGQCDPCDTLVRGNTVEHNAIGMEVTNASRGLWFAGNTIRANRVGITVNSNNLEALGPQHEATVVGNLIVGNNDAASPEQADGGFGIGIGVGGGTRNLFLNNRIEDHRVASFVLRDVQGYPVADNRITGNALGAEDLALLLEAPRTRGNCLTGGVGGDGDAGAPRVLPEPAPAGLTRCPGVDEPVGAGADGGAGAKGTARPRVTPPPGVSFRVVRAPAPQPGLPDALRAPARPARNLPGPVRVEDHPLPAAPTS